MGGSGGETPRACATDIDVGETQPFGDVTPTPTEGVTFDTDGTLYVSARNTTGDDQLLAFSPDGSFTSVAESPSILGLESNDGTVIAAGIATGELLEIDPSNGDVTTIADDLGAPNFVVTTPWGTWLVSDDTFGEDEIDEVTFDGVASTWVGGIPTPNGMVFSLDASVLYVATTFEQPGLWRIPVSDEGIPGTPELWVPFEPGTTPDGVAIDSEGNVYVALNLAGQIARVDPAGEVTMLAEAGAPASLAFGQGDYDPCSLYVTNLFGDQVWRVGTGVLGVPKP